MLPAAPEHCIKVRTYLTMKPAECTTGPGLDAPRGLMFVGRDTTGLLVGDFRAQWMGADALQFFKDHHDELRAGRCLDLEVYGVMPIKGEHVGHIKTCQLAPMPPSWARHAEKLSATATEHHA